MEKSNIVFSLSHQCEKTLECGEKINKIYIWNLSLESCLAEILACLTIDFV